MTKNTFIIIVVVLMMLAVCSSDQADISGSQPPDFTLSSLDGQTYTLSALKGNVVLVDFWATWCPPCRNSIPHLIELYGKYGEKGFVVLGISMEDKETLESFKQNNGITYPILLGDNEVGRAYNVQAIPKSIFIDKKGKIRKTQVGFSPELAPIFDAFVDSLVQE